MDSNLGNSATSEACKLILVSSLANVPNAILGLSLSEIVSYMCAPARDVSTINDILSTLTTKAWYLHSNREGKLYFTKVQNLVAKLKTIAESLNRESSIKELKGRLIDMFTPSLRDCYQEVLALPPVDEISIKPDKVTLVIYEPTQISTLHPDLQKFYENLEYKNRILFLSGQRGTLEKLIEISAEAKAITIILAEMDSEGVPDNDPQHLAAVDMHDKISHRLLSAARETFTTLIFPHMDGLKTADFLMNFTENKYRGEQQVRETLKAKQKFTDDIASDKVLISEHFSQDDTEEKMTLTFALGKEDCNLRVILDRNKWNEIADAAKAEFNQRLKKSGIKTGKWQAGKNSLSRLFGKELVLLAWAIEDADPALIPVAIKNWQGLMPEERWWLYTMTNAATGHAVQGRNKGWRKAVRYALTENPVSDYSHAHRIELFKDVDIESEKTIRRAVSPSKKKLSKKRNNSTELSLLD